jgi:hypothetical protein
MNSASFYFSTIAMAGIDGADLNSKSACPAIPGRKTGQALGGDLE